MVRAIDELGGGADDAAVFSFAREQNRVIITYNNVDFIQLGEVIPDHPGMLLIYQDNKPNDMDTPDIVKALANVEKTYVEGIAGETVPLNGYSW